PEGAPIPLSFCQTLFCHFGSPTLSVFAFLLSAFAISAFPVTVPHAVRKTVEPRSTPAAASRAAGLLVPGFPARNPAGAIPSGGRPGQQIVLPIRDRHPDLPRRGADFGASILEAARDDLERIS